MFVYVCLFIGMLGASASDIRFHYENLEIFRRDDNNVCKICYGVDCFEMDHIRCKYYVETDKLIPETVQENASNPEMSAQVDDMMHTFVEKAAELTSECIPLVSSYTDCHKENICTGCTSCECDGTGSWNCNTVQKCLADPSIDINHRVLFKVIENLRGGDQSNRIKRSVKNKNDVNETKMRYEELSKWFFDVQPQLIEQLQPTTTNENHQKVLDSEILTKAPIIIEQNIPDNTTIVVIKPDTVIDNDYLAFEEVLNNIAVDNTNYTRQKPILVERNDTFFDYMLFDEYNETVNGFKFKDKSQETSNILVAGGDSTTFNMKGVTEVVINLLESSKGNNIADDSNITDYMNDYEKNNYIDPANEIELNAINIMKRDVVTQNSSEIQDLNKNEDCNSTSDTIELKNDVLLPLSNLITVKQKELDDLLNISENLIKFMKSNNSEDIDTNAYAHNNDTETNSTFTIYKLDIVPEFDYTYGLRRTNNNILKEILYKLKKDIYEVISDIVTIQKLTNLGQLPQDFKKLIHALKTYVRSQKNNSKEENMENTNENNFRRHWRNDNAQYSNTIIDDLTAILEVVDKNRPQSNALAPLSNSSKKILKRIMEHKIVDDFAESSVRVSDKNYNLTNDLQSIGVKWQEMTKYITKSTVFNRLYSMKLLHIVLYSDIEKMNDALVLINFAHNRRMSPIDGPIGYRIIDKIDRGLRTINEKIKVIINLHNKGFQSNNNTKTLRKKFKKDSFFMKLRNVLRNSKKDIISFIRQKVKNHDLAKEVARKKLDDITRRKFTEFEETMKKWQNNLDLAPRDKRSLRNMKYKNRIKNILPKYLRGKVNPAIIAKNMENNNLKRNKKNSRLPKY